MNIGELYCYRRPDSWLSPGKSPLPDISNNVGSVKLFFNTLLSSYLKEVFSFVLFRFLFSPASTTTARFAIFRSASVRPKHLFDQNFDHDYFFKLPFQGAGCPIKWTAL